MKKILFLFFFSLLLYSCEKNPVVPYEEFNFQGTGKIKTLLIYSTSTHVQPYVTNSYTYDSNWNLKKILILDNPTHVSGSYTYEYSSTGDLINKKYNRIEGANHTVQAESDLMLIKEYRYSYRGKTKIESVYRFNVLSDSTVYTYMNDLLVSEYYYDLDGDLSYNRKYEYDPENKLIKETYSPDAMSLIYTYEGSHVAKITEYDGNGSIMMENTYRYTKSDGKVIVELYNKDFLSAKTTYKDGNVIEEIKYHPTFLGAEWYCYRYEYY